MSGSTQGKNFSLMLGASRLGVEPVELGPALVIPAAPDLIKEEDKTLVWRLKLAAGESGVVKMYRRRGPLDWCWERALQFRVQREYEALCALEIAGVPCSVPLFWGYGSAVEHGRFEILVTREIPDAANLKAWLTAGPKSLSADDLLPLFDIIRRMHRCGMYHGALSPKNILVTQSQEKGHAFYLIDLARAIQFPKDISQTSMARADLLSVMRRLVQMRGNAGCKEMLLQYGWPKSELDTFMARLKQHPSSRRLRNRLTLEFTIRYWIARVLG